MGLSNDEFNQGYVLTACIWSVDPESQEYKQRALDHYKDCHSVLLEFLRSERLTVDPSFGKNVQDWISFELHTSDLTEEGLELFKLCSSWSPSYGNGKSKRHLVQWRKKLDVLRKSS